MNLREIYNDGCSDGVSKKLPKISFEIFPPKDGDISNLFDTVRILKKYNPALISMEFGIKENMKALSFEILKMLINLEFEVMPHLTCITKSRQEIDNELTRIENLGIENILASRGNLSGGMNSSMFDFPHADKFIEYIHHKTTLSVGTAEYPEGNIEYNDIHKDIEHLKQKIDNGAETIFTQFCFNNDKFHRYIELVRNAGITAPVIAGLMPVRSLKHLQDITAKTNIEVPEKLKEQLENFPADSKKIGTEFAISQCHDLIDTGICGIHFFTMNHSDMIPEIMNNIM